MSNEIPNGVEGCKSIKLTDVQRDTLAQVCRTNGGGVRIRCKVGDDGYGIPVSTTFRKLLALGLIQGKAGSFETVVHTRDGLALHRKTPEPIRL